MENTGIESPEFNPTNIDAQLRAKKSAEAFANMAEEIVQETHQYHQQSQQPQQPAQQQPSEISTSDLGVTPKSRQEKKINFGPKYLEALEQVSIAADIRSIEVELPITRKKVEVSPLTGKEEQVLRTASISPEGFLKKLDELLFQHVKYLIGGPRTYQEFLESLFQPDKAIMVWALLNTTYLVLPTLEKKCNKCENTYPVEAQPSELFHDDTFEKIWDKEESAQVYSEEQVIEITKGAIVFEIGMPSELNKIALIGSMHPQETKNNIETTGDMLSPADNIVFFTKSITIIDEIGEKIILTDLLQDIYPFLKNIHPKVMDAIVSKLDLEIYNKYMPNLYLNTVCPNCGAVEKAFIDPEITFFRKTLSL